MDFQEPKGYFMEMMLKQRCFQYWSLHPRSWSRTEDTQDQGGCEEGEDYVPLQGISHIVQ